MNSDNRQPILLLRHIRAVNNAVQSDALLQSLERVSLPFVVSFINSHAFNLACDNPAFAADLLRADLLLRDGVGMSLMMRALGMDAGLNMNGTDLIPHIIPRFKGRRVVICGTAMPWLAQAADFVRAQGCEVALTLDGFREPDAYASAIAEAQPALVLLGMGMPKQEAIASMLAARLQGPVVIINGGAILDFWANRFPRAPMLLQRLRLEWLFRLIQEPKRLWRRYLLGGAIFMFRIVQLKAGAR